MIIARILKYEPICNAFSGAITSASDVPSLVPLVDGVPIYPKGSLVAYEETALKSWKGHAVRGQLRTISEVALSEVAARITAEDIGSPVPMPEADEVSEDWGLT